MRTAPLIACILIATRALAQIPMQPPSEGNSQGASQGEAPLATAPQQEPAPLPSAASMIGPQVSKLEDDLAQLVQSRDTLPPQTLPWLDLKIDSRIFARWLLAQSAAAKDQSNSQIAAYLHGASMLGVVPAIDDFVSKQSAAPDSVQTIGLSRLHQFTFQLKDTADTAQLDSASTEVAQDILIALSPMQSGNRLPALLPMRPDVAAATTSGSTADQSSGRSPEELAELARQASVSPALRKQLIAISNLEQQAQADPNQSSAATALSDELQRALDLAAGLQANTAVDAQERAQIESQLCDGLALFSDPRMRSAGSARLAQLDEYRQLLGRVQKMRVPPELKDSLAPALAWAHENPDKGDEVLSSVEKFVALCNRQDARPPQPDEFASLRPIDPLRRAYEAVTKQFEKARADFLTDAASLSQTPAAAADDAPPTATGPRALSDRVTEMTRAADLLDVLVALPASIQTLDASKPYPYGGVARHTSTLLITIQSPIKSPARDEATRQLFDLHKLAEVAKTLSAAAATDTIPPAIAQTYTGGLLAATETKWKSMVTSLSTSFATNQAMDPDALEHLKALAGLFDALGPAAEMETALAKPDALNKWADWSMTPDQIHALLAPYQEGMSQAFAGFTSDNPDALLAFSKLRHHYEPFMKLLVQTTSYAPACQALPDGTVGLLSRLSTPYQKAPFSHQRFASFIAALGTAASADPAVAQTAAGTISDRLSH
jgi:hypothetical protein